MKNVSDIYPLSPMQEIMLVHALAHPKDDRLFNQVIYRLAGSLDPVIYEQCWKEVTRRHPMLRTMYLWEGLKAPVQVIKEDVELEWRNYDWRDMNSSEQDACLSDLLQEDKMRGFSINQAPLTRLALCRRADNIYTLVWSSHHLILDRWCIPLLLNETASLYQSHQQGIAANLAPPRPFRDYIAWLKQQNMADAERFWRGELDGCTTPTRLSSGRPADAAGAFQDQTLLIDKNKTDSLRRFAAHHRLTMSTLVLGAWALLHRLVNSGNDLLLGLTISGRPGDLPGVEGMVGSFINNVPLRVSFADDRPITAWLQELQDRQQAVQVYGFVSPSQIQEWSAAAEPGGLYETLFLYQSPVRMPKSHFEMQVEQSGFQSTFPITLAAEDGADGLLLWINYAERSFTSGDITWLLMGLEKALDIISAEPDAPIFSILDQLPQPAVTAVPETAAPSALSVPHQLPRTGFEARLFNLLANILGHQSFGIGDNIFELGATSLQLVQLVSRIQQSFGKNFSVAALFANPSIEKLSLALNQDATSQPWSSLVPIKPIGRKPPIFLVHHGGGGITGYAKLAQKLDPDRPLYGLQEPGIEHGQALPNSIDEIVQVYVKEIQSVQPHGPYIIGGFCFGGVVAFEISQQLQKLGESVALLILIDAILPGAVVSNKLNDRLAVHQARVAGRSLLWKIGYVVYRVGFRLQKEVEFMHERVRRLIDRLTFAVFERQKRPIPSILRQRRLLELNGQFNDAYAPQPYRGRTALVRGVYPELRYREDFDWNTVIQPAVQIYYIETDDHLNMLVQPEKLAVLVQHLRHALSEDPVNGKPIEKP